MVTNYILTLVSRKAITPRLDSLAAALSAQQLQIISKRHLNSAFGKAQKNDFSDAYAIEISGQLTPDQSKSLTQRLAKIFSLDVFIQEKLAAQTAKKLACFDMDSTLIQHEVMDELAYRYGIGEEISAITESAMRGELSFRESFTQRLACLEGFDASLIPDIATGLKLMPGAETLIKTLRHKGLKIAILSGGFNNFAVHLQTALGELDAIHANVLEVKDGFLTGKISNEIIDEKRKLVLIHSLADEYGIHVSDIIAVGDGANDIPMIQNAGLGIAFRAKPIVQEHALHCINHGDLSSILYILGYDQSEFVHS